MSAYWALLLFVPNPMSSNKYAILPKLTKDYILQRISQEDIFASYLDIDKATIDWCLQGRSNLIKSTLRKDREPTCGFARVGIDRIRFKDFSGFFWGDCFDLVGHLNNWDTNSSVGFALILDHIAQTFKLHKYANGLIAPAKYLNTSPNIDTIVPKQFTEITIETRDWNEIDAEFWTRIHLTKSDLQAGRVYAVDTVEIRGTTYYNYYERPDYDVAYAYYFGVDAESGKAITKVYFPKRKERRFLMNKPVLEGLADVQAARIGVITKSYKDVLAFRKLTRGVFDVDVIGIPSEHYLITKEEYHKLKRETFDIVVTLLDFDRAGRNTAWKYRTVYNIPFLFLTNGKNKTINYGSKDFTDYLAKNGKDKTLELIEKSFNYVINKYQTPNLL